MVDAAIVHRLGDVGDGIFRRGAWRRACRRPRAGCRRRCCRRSTPSAVGRRRRTPRRSSCWDGAGRWSSVEDDFDADGFEGAHQGAVGPVAAAGGREAAVQGDAHARGRRRRATARKSAPPAGGRCCGCWRGPRRWHRLRRWIAGGRSWGFRGGGGGGAAEGVEERTASASQISAPLRTRFQPSETAASARVEKQPQEASMPRTRLREMAMVKTASMPAMRSAPAARRRAGPASTARPAGAFDPRQEEGHEVDECPGQDAVAVHGQREQPRDRGSWRCRRRGRRRRRRGAPAR
jgi:hypothetical protein